MSKQKSTSTKKKKVLLADLANEKGKKRMSTLANLAKKQEDMEAQMRAIAQDSVTPALKEAFTELKSAIPNLSAVRWNQYTPYFNDGDECVFSVHGVYFQLDDKEEGGDYDDGFEYISDYGSYDATTGLNDEGLTKAQNSALVTFEKNVNSIEEMLKVAFGDHTQVTVTASGIESDEYEHE